MLPYILTQSFVWVRYFLDFFLPVNLSADSDWTVLNNLFDERIIIGCIFFIALVIIIFKTSSKSETRPIAFGLIWFAAALLPTSLAPFAEVTNDHRMYFPFIGLALSVVSYAGLLLRRYRSTANSKLLISAVVTIFVCFLLLNAYGASQRNKVWKTEESLWRDVVIESPNNGRGMMNYGLALMAKRDFIMAGFYFKQAKRLLPTYNLVYVNIGIMDEYTGDSKGADESFKQGIALDTNYFASYYFYGQFLVKSGQIAQAKPIAEKAFAINPYDEKSSNLLMNVYYQLGLWDQMQKAAQHIYAIMPTTHIAQVYLQAAKDHALVVADDNGIIPESAPAYLDLSLQYYNQGQYLKCIAACNEALRMNPSYADAYNNIAAADIKLSQWNDAIIASKKALAIDPNHNLATGNLKYAENQLKK